MGTVALSNRTQLFVSSHLLLAANACSASLSPQSLAQGPKPTVSVLAHCCCSTLWVQLHATQLHPSPRLSSLSFFWEAYLSIKDPLTRLDPVHPSMPGRLDPLRGLVHGSIEGLGPVPFVQPLCKHLHRPLSHLDLPSAFICALVHRRERTRG